MSEWITESELEDSALSWFNNLGFEVLNGPDIAPGEPKAKRDDYGQVVLHLEESRTLAALCDALLPKLLSGEIRVKDAEKFVENAS